MSAAGVAPSGLIRALIDGQPAVGLDVLDRGLHYGDGLFETIACRAGHARFLDLHLQRLTAGCTRLGIRYAQFPAIAATIRELAAAQPACVIKLILTRGSATARGETAKWTTGSLAGVVIPTPDEIKGHGKFRPFKAVAMSALALSGTDIATPVVAASFAANIGDVVDGAPSTILVHVTGVKVPMELAANTLAGTLVGLLDYKTLLADVTMDSAYDTAAHTAAINALTIDIADVGKITIAGKASGFSVRALADSQHSADARAAAQLDALSVRLDNAGFVERLLDMQAKMLGGTRDDVRAQLVDGALPFALSFVDNAAFRDQFLAAVTVFLKDPHSLTITFAPAKPVPLGQVMRAAAHRPGTLPDLLTPTVEANN